MSFDTAVHETWNVLYLKIKGKKWEEISVIVNRDIGKVVVTQKNCVLSFKLLFDILLQLEKMERHADKI